MVKSYSFVSHSTIDLKPSSHNCFDDTALRILIKACAHTEIEFPFRVPVYVGCQKKLVFHIGGGIKTCDRAYRSVIFKAQGEFRSEGVAAFYIRRKNRGDPFIITFERFFQRGIE